MPKMPQPKPHKTAESSLSPELLAKRDAYLKVLQGEDLMGVVIRAHIYIEHQLNDLLDAAVADARALKGLNLDYNGKVTLATALGLDRSYRPMLSCVGKLRNSFAHNLDAEVGPQQIADLKTAMGRHYDVAQQSLALTDKKMGNPPRKLSSLDAREHLLLMLITIWSAIATQTVRHIELVAPYS